MSLNISSWALAPANSVAFINGSIYTVDTTNPWASGFVVSPEGIFTHVGSTEEVASLANRSQLIVVDLKGNFTMPGIHDAHAHLMLSGLALISDANIGTNVTSFNIAERVQEGECACEYINAYQNWILAGQYTSEGFPNNTVDRQYLDTAFPDRPVAVGGGAGHGALLNTAALELAGYDVDNEPDTQGSIFLRRPDGSLTGELGETAMNKFGVSLPRPGTPHIKRALKRAMETAHRSGITSAQEASGNTMLLRALSEMEREGTVKLDVFTHIVYGPEWVSRESKDDSVRLLAEAEEFRSTHVHPNFVKIVLDGVPLPPFLSHAPLDADGKVNSTHIQVLDVAEAVNQYDRLGMTVKIHCTGEGATRMALDAIEAARKNNPGGPRHEIAHNSGVNEGDYERYAGLNVTAEMSPAAFFGSELEQGSELMDWNFAKMRSAGAHITVGSDWGAAPDPTILSFMANKLEQIGDGSIEKGAELALQMLTLNGAQAVGREREVGSIQVGKKANFIVVDRDLSRGEFAEASVLRTYFEGEKVWDAARP
ncbi:amidohydrolase 3 [Aaosphaeria arxii CBS 175.79]|uniref:Amidohydrolase 3 n=1 Tax=Aaosphaeria arxii CBS 175.79 TaxID=1450172 RepID=A0A6A5XGQ9_9PLEO|nr:amidohydrolase 3 [Aaosphaeria arxii CBS 175.79]KAF2011981.1 amidohydrolase 3 [Aaosphaeria arxii CBS 175.79]